VLLMALGQIAFPLRHGKPYGAVSSSFTFLLAGAEFTALLFGGTALTGSSPMDAAFAMALLPAAYVVAAAAAGVMFFVTRARSKNLETRFLAEQMDLETLRQRVIGELRAEAESKPKSRTRQILDEHRAATGAAGVSRRR
jgi:lipopolysaccharide export LptBFGC system permease protein LptF